MSAPPTSVDDPPVEHDAPRRVPLVDYLVLGDEPRLVANECVECGARYFGRRNACASCTARTFRTVEVSVTGEVQAFTIVAMAAPSVDVPFVSAIIDCDGTTVSANLVNTPPDLDHVRLGMTVRLATYVMGTDSAGTEAIAFGFEPISTK